MLSFIRNVWIFHKIRTGSSISLKRGRAISRRESSGHLTGGKIQTKRGRRCKKYRSKESGYKEYRSREHRSKGSGRTKKYRNEWSDSECDRSFCAERYIWQCKMEIIRYDTDDHRFRCNAGCKSVRTCTVERTQCKECSDQWGDYRDRTAELLQNEFHYIG